MKLLIIEDEPEMLNSLEDFAIEEGFTCDTARNYWEGTERINLYDYDCIILDINLPDGSGFDLLEALHKTNKENYKSIKEYIEIYKEIKNTFIQNF